MIPENRTLALSFARSWIAFSGTIREGGVVGTLSALEANDPQEDFLARRSEPGGVLDAKSPRQKPVLQGLDHLGHQHADFQTRRGGLRISQLLAELFDACPHEADPSFGVKREVSAFFRG